MLQPKNKKKDKNEEKENQDKIEYKSNESEIINIDFNLFRLNNPFIKKLAKNSKVIWKLMWKLWSPRGTPG